MFYITSISLHPCQYLECLKPCEFNFLIRCNTVHCLLKILYLALYYLVNVLKVGVWKYEVDVSNIWKFLWFRNFIISFGILCIVLYDLHNNYPTCKIYSCGKKKWYFIRILPRIIIGILNRYRSVGYNVSNLSIIVITKLLFKKGNLIYDINFNLV